MESKNNLETYLYNLKTSYEDTLKGKISEDDQEELKSSVEGALDVRTARSVTRWLGYMAVFGHTIMIGPFGYYDIRLIIIFGHNVFFFTFFGRDQTTTDQYSRSR